MIRRPPRSTLDRSSAASDVYKRQDYAAKRNELESRLATLLAKEGLTPDADKMPLDAGIKTELPDQKIR